MTQFLITISGNVSRYLCQHVKTVVGVDISQAAVNRYNAQAANQGLEPEEMQAICADLQGKQGELDGLKFDIVVVRALYQVAVCTENSRIRLGSAVRRITISPR